MKLVFLIFWLYSFYFSMSVFCLALYANIKHHNSKHQNDPKIVHKAKQAEQRNLDMESHLKLLETYWHYKTDSTPP